MGDGDGTRSIYEGFYCFGSIFIAGQYIVQGGLQMYKNERIACILASLRI
jgi:hypothetical protein